MSRRRLDVGPDGMANVLLLTDPIPRHLSIVSWGANDLPARSWKSAAPAEVLRSPPSAEVIDIGGLSLQRVQSFVAETLDAWIATVKDVLATPLSSDERAARVRGLTSQAGARVAAFAAAVGPKLAQAAESYKSVDLSLPDPPSASTLQGEIDRRKFVSGLEQASGSLSDSVISRMRDLGGRSTESILLAFGQAGDVFAKWAASMPSGVVGVGGPEPAQKVGNRNNKGDAARLNKILTLVKELIGKDSESTEKNMSITIEDLQALAAENPAEFLGVLNSALEAVKSSQPEVAKKFMWGDTGVEQFTPETVMGALRNMINGDQLANLIAQAVGGVDVNAAASGDSPQVAATMRSALSKFVTHELSVNPDGELSQAVKAAVAPSMAEAIRQSLQAIVGSDGPTNEAGAFGLGGFEINDDDDPLQVEMPQLHGIVR